MAKAVKRNKFLSKYLNGSRKNKTQLIVFVLLFAGIAGYFIYKSFAYNVDLSSYGQVIVAERVNPAMGMVGDGTKLVMPNTTSFRIYEGGLAVCGDYNDSSHPERYYSTQLSQTEVEDFLANIQQTNFYTLNSNYGSDKANVLVSNDVQKLAFLDSNDVGKAVYVTPGSKRIPQAYKDANKIVDKFCNSLTTPYVPEQVTVTTLATSSSAPNTGEQLPADVSVGKRNDHPPQKLHGTEAAAVHKLVGKHGLATVKKGSETVQIREDEALPLSRGIQDNVNSKHLQVSKLPSFLQTPKAYALPYSDFQRLCASNVCDKPKNIPDIVNHVQNIYARSMNQHFAPRINADYHSRHDWAWLVTCHGFYVACGGGPLTNVLTNITYEWKVENGWQGTNHPVSFVLGFTAGDNQACGVAFQGAPSFAVSDDYAAPGYSCTAGQMVYASAAHEYSHALGLSHANSATLMFPSACYGGRITFDQCLIDGLQTIWLDQNSAYLEPNK